MTSLDSVVMVPQQAAHYRCPLCHDTGAALYLTDTHTGEKAGPYGTDSDVWVQFSKVQDMYEARYLATDGKDGLTPRQFAFRFYVTTGMCICPPEARALRQDTRAADRIKHLGIRFDTSRYDNLSYETLIERCGAESSKLAAISAVRDYATAGEYLGNPLTGVKGKRSLVLHGASGTGKTGLAVLLWRYCTAPNALVEFREMMRVIQDSYGRKGSDSSQIVQAFQHVPVLFLDDVGDAESKKTSEDKRDKLYQILDPRHKADLPTVLTTNLNRNQFRDQFGLRIEQRLEEMAAWVEVTGEVLR